MSATTCQHGFDSDQLAACECEVCALRSLAHDLAAALDDARSEVAYLNLPEPELSSAWVPQYTDDDRAILVARAHGMGVI